MDVIKLCVLITYLVFVKKKNNFLVDDEIITRQR